MFSREKIFTVYEKPEKADPADRAILLAEGFSWGSLLLGVLWLAYKRFWALAGLFLLAAIALTVAAEMLHLSEAVTLLLNAWLQLMLAYHLYDLQGWWLKRKQYRFAGVLAAESRMHAERRYYEFAA